jgi:UDP-glucose 4-epimerase
MDTLLVTGGAGYIGSHTIIDLLEKTDLNIVSIDNFSNAHSGTFERIRKITGKTVKNYNINLSDPVKTAAVFASESNIIGVIHFAAFKSVPESIKVPYNYYHNNITSLLNLLELCKAYRVDSFIFSSSCAVYGNTDALPVKETTPLGKAQSPYAYTKQVGEQLLQDYAVACPSLKIIALRYFNPVGAHTSGLIGELPIHKPSNLFPVITQTGIGKIESFTVFGNDYDTRDGSCIRDYVHVTDISNAHVKAFQKLRSGHTLPGFSIYNLGSGQGVSVFEAIQAFEDVAQMRVNYKIGEKRPGDIAAIYSDPSHSKQELKWEPQFSLYEMMESAWKWELHMNRVNQDHHW